MTPGALTELPRGLWIAAPNGHWLDRVEIPLPIADSQIPIRFLSEHDLELVAVNPPGAFGQPDPPVHMSDGRREYRWNPFADRLDQPRFNQSYGLVSIELSGRTFVRFRLVVEVVPGGLSLRQLQAMRRTLAQVADELLRSGRSGATRTAVGLSAETPREGAETQLQLERYVRPVLGALRSVNTCPYTNPLARRPGLRPDLPHRAAQLGTLDVAENRFVGHAISTWRKMLKDCEARAALAAEEAISRPLAFGGEHAEKVPSQVVQEAELEASAYRGSAASARDLADSLQRAGRRLQDLPRPARTLCVTPRTLRRGDYHQVVRAFSRIRREVSIAVTERDATRKDALASFLYEKWVLFALAHLTMTAGYSPADDAWLQPVDLGRYEVTVRTSRPWSFRAGAWLLQLAFEPVLLSMKPKGKAGGSREGGIRRLQEDVLFPDARGYIVGRARTPDYLVILTRDSGESCVLVGDAQFNQITLSDLEEPRRADTETRLGYLKTKARVVQDDYARKIWIVNESGAIIPSLEHLGFVVFPGPASARTALWSDDDDFKLFPLAPANELDDEFGIDDAEAASALWCSLLQEAIDNASAPTRFVSNVRGPFRLRG